MNDTLSRPESADTPTTISADERPLLVPMCPHCSSQGSTYSGQLSRDRPTGPLIDPPVDLRRCTYCETEYRADGEPYDAAASRAAWDDYAAAGMIDEVKPPGREAHVSREASVETDETAVILLPIGEIDPSPLNPRKQFDADDLAELAVSILEVGLLQPILVRPAPGDRYWIVAGERRYRACKLASIPAIRAVVRTDIASDADHLICSIEENAKRRDVNPIELARAYAALADLGVEQKEIGRRVGRERSVISNAIRLLKLPAEVLSLVEDGALSEASARAIIRYADWPETAVAIARYAVANRVPSKELEGGMGWNMSYDLQRQKLIVKTSNRDFERACNACPFDAYRKDAHGNGTCYRPDHHRELEEADRKALEEKTRKEVEALQKRAVADKQVIAKMAAAGIAPAAGQKAPAIPRMRELRCKYEEISSHNKVDGCTEACECRAIALGWDDKPHPVCIMPGRRNALKAKASRAWKKDVRDTLEERCQALTDPASFAPDMLGRISRALAIDAWSFMRNLPVEIKRAAAKQIADSSPLNPLLNEQGHNIKDAEAWEILSRQGRDNLILLIAELRLRLETHEKLEYGQTRCDFPQAAFILNGPAPKRGASKPQSYRDCPGCKGMARYKPASGDKPDRYECGCGHSEPLETAEEEQAA